MELLAPAGSMDALKSAINMGADAVYFGGAKMNARIFGKNFSDEEIEIASKYTRKFNVKSYLTLNTLVSDKEFLELEEFLRYINTVPIDGIIVQDLGVASFIKSKTPDLPIHASTQMTIHNLEGINTAKDLGFSRAVISRELPKSEIRYICENSPIEIEAFIHGALCMCYSGQCYLSSVIGDRSGNRGKCAQPCRKKYQNGYELSLKDLCMAGDFEELINLGVHSLKIEGRMKSPDYVAGVVEIYRNLIDQKRSATQKEIERLSALFSRDGFTNAYFNDCVSKKMFGVRSKENKAQSKEQIVEITDKKIPVSGEFYATLGNPVKLELKTGNISVIKEENEPFTAQKQATTKEDCIKQLSKFGGTDFYLSDISCDIQDGLFIPIGSLNKLRRECIKELEEKLVSVEERRFIKENEIISECEQKQIKIAYCKTEEQAKAVADYVDEIRLPLFKIKENTGKKICAVLPNIIFDREWENVLEKLEEIRGFGIFDVACGNIGTARKCKDLGFNVHGEPNLNIFNSMSISEAKKLGFSDVALSFEMNFAQIRHIKKQIQCNVFVYGRYPVMTIQNCLIKNRGECIDFKGYSTLNDETGRSFPVFCEYPHRNVIYNSVPLYLAEKTDDLPKCGQYFCFTTEKGEEAKRILKMYDGKSEYKGEFTRGFMKKKV